MTSQAWSLISSETDEGEILDRGGTPELGFVRRRLCAGLSQGVILLDITCGDLAFSLLPQRGMSLWRATVRGVPFGWQSPVPGPVHPRHVAVRDPSGLGFLDGFDELLTRCGLSSSGAPEFEPSGRLRFPLHGRIGNLPAQKLEIQIDPSAGTCEVRSVVREARFHFGAFELQTLLRVRQGENRIELHDAIRNCGAQPAVAQLLYHINFGPPLLEENAEFWAPVREIAPRDVHAANGIEHWNRFRGPTPGLAEECIYMDLHADPHRQTQAMVCNANRSLGAVVRYNARQLPHFTLWKDMGGLADGYVTGMEPGTNFPNIRSFEEGRGRVLQLAPGEVYPVDLELGFCVDSASVANQVKAIQQLQSAPPKILQWMDEKYSPEGISDLS